MEFRTMIDRALIAMGWIAPPPPPAEKPLEVLLRTRDKVAAGAGFDDLTRNEQAAYIAAMITPTPSAEAALERLGLNTPTPSAGEASEPQ